ncbi:MAG: exodeoxyribonuclease VII small subunit [Gammaproteobacteria bacterium]|jgi:exodeoxyribonuclease VII small subunit|nr:exodeoxyribonuclease VII small subunit [Gammaproteobacteria bacterium]
MDLLPVPEKKARAPDLEKSLAALEAVVAELEDGDLPLEKALQQFEAGVKLSRDCQHALDAAEQRVKVLVDENLRDFSPNADDAEV